MRICFARVMLVCFRFLAWNLCFFRRLVLGFSEFRRFCSPGLLAVGLLGRVLGWFGACLLLDLFFFEAPIPSLFGGWPLCGIFYLSLSLVVPICYIFLLISHICSHVCHILIRTRSYSCSKFAAPSPSSSMVVSSVNLPLMISLESFLTLSRCLFSSTC